MAIKGSLPMLLLQCTYALISQNGSIFPYPFNRGLLLDFNFSYSCMALQLYRTVPDASHWKEHNRLNSTQTK